MNSAFHKTLLALLLLAAVFSAQGAQIQYVHRVTPSADGKSATLERRNAAGGNWQSFVELPSRYAPGSAWGWGWPFRWAAQDPGSGTFCLEYTVYGDVLDLAVFKSESFKGCTFDSGNSWHWIKDSAVPFYGNVQKVRLQQGRAVISTTGGEYVASIDTSGAATPPYDLKIEQTKDYGCGTLCTQLLTGLSRVWYDPSQSGQGLTYTYIPTPTPSDLGGVTKWSYFTAYDTDGSSAWWLGRDGAQAPAIESLLSYSGPAIQRSWTTGQVSSNEVGYMDYEFIYPSQMNVTLHYGTYLSGQRVDPNAWQKSLILVPFDTPPTGGTPNCTGVPANATCADIALEGRSRVWYDPAQSGQGFTLTAVNGMYWGYYTAYDSEGKAAWWLFNSVGPLDGSNQFSFDLMDYSGPPLYTTWDAGKISSRVVGSGTLVMTSASQMSLTIRIGNTVRTLNLVPFDLP